MNSGPDQRGSGPGGGGLPMNALEYMSSRRVGRGRSATLHTLDVGLVAGAADHRNLTAYLANPKTRKACETMRSSIQTRLLAESHLFIFTCNQAAGFLLTLLLSLSHALISLTATLNCFNSSSCCRMNKLSLSGPITFSISCSVSYTIFRNGFL